MGFTLSLSTNPFVNRFAEPEDLIGVLAGEIGIGRIQLTHEFVDPAWPPSLIRRMTERMAKGCGRAGRGGDIDDDGPLRQAEPLRPPGPRGAPPFGRLV